MFYWDSPSGKSLVWKLLPNIEFSRLPTPWDLVKENRKYAKECSIHKIKGWAYMSILTVGKKTRKITPTNQHEDVCRTCYKLPAFLCFLDFLANTFACLICVRKELIDLQSLQSDLHLRYMYLLWPYNCSCDSTI